MRANCGRTGVAVRGADKHGGGACKQGSLRGAVGRMDERMVVPHARARAQVGWFLHTPFPSSEIYRTLPVREEVLKAVLRADLIGFHTYDYARHFVSACTRILGLEARAPPCSPASHGKLLHAARADRAPSARPAASLCHTDLLRHTEGALLFPDPHALWPCHSVKACHN